MTKPEIETTFKTYINQAKFMGFDNSIKIYANQIVSIDKFLNLFGNVSLTYDDLISFDNGVMNYKNFFDQCKEDGVL